jgi:hypothetical protein
MFAKTAFNYIKQPNSQSLIRFSGAGKTSISLKERHNFFKNQLFIPRNHPLQNDSNKPERLVIRTANKKNAAN